MRALTERELCGLLLSRTQLEGVLSDLPTSEDVPIFATLRRFAEALKVAVDDTYQEAERRAARHGMHDAGCPCPACEEIRDQAGAERALAARKALVDPSEHDPYDPRCGCEGCTADRVAERDESEPREVLHSGYFSIVDASKVARDRGETSSR